MQEHRTIYDELILKEPLYHNLVLTTSVTKSSNNASIGGIDLLQSITAVTSINVKKIKSRFIMLTPDGNSTATFMLLRFNKHLHRS